MRSMTLLAALCVAACGSPDRRAPGATGAPASASQSADQLALRVSRAGGVARVLSWPNGDSALWTAPAPVPPLSAVLAFDDEDGAVAAMDSGGHPVRIELRAGRVVPEKVRLTEARSADGWATFGVAERTVRRLTPTGESWSAPFDRVPEAVVPTTDGAVLVVLTRDDGAHVYRARPPAPKLADSLVVPGARYAGATALGDRLFLVSSSGLTGVRTRDLKAGAPVELGGTLRALVASPSGDRVFALAGDATALVVVDRYREEVERRVPLPGVATALRMDPFGRWLLVRGAGDALYVIALGSMTHVATTSSIWRADLPSVAPDGSVARLVGADVVQWDPSTQRALRTHAGGADEFWYLFSWNGFRTPSRTEAPVEFAASSADSALDSLRAPEPSADAPAPASAPTPRSTAPSPPEVRDASGRLMSPGSMPTPMPARFFVSLAALPSAAAAESLARVVVVDGEHPHVVPARVVGREVWRVVLGPYATREAAVKVGRAARRDYYVFEGTP